MDRTVITSAKRIVIKIGSSSLTGSAGSNLDATAVEKIVTVIASLKARGAEGLVNRSLQPGIFRAFNSLVTGSSDNRRCCASLALSECTSNTF